MRDEATNAASNAERSGAPVFLLLTAPSVPAGVTRTRDTLRQMGVARGATPSGSGTVSMNEFGVKPKTPRALSFIGMVMVSTERPGAKRASPTSPLSATVNVWFSSGVASSMMVSVMVRMNTPAPKTSVPDAAT